MVRDFQYLLDKVRNVQLAGLVSHLVSPMSEKKEKYIHSSSYNVQAPTLQFYTNIEYSSILLAPMMQKKKKNQNKLNKWNMV